MNCFFSNIGSRKKQKVAAAHDLHHISYRPDMVFLKHEYNRVPTDNPGKFYSAPFSDARARYLPVRYGTQGVDSLRLHLEPRSEAGLLRRSHVIRRPAHRFSNFFKGCPALASFSGALPASRVSERKIFLRMAMPGGGLVRTGRLSHPPDHRKKKPVCRKTE